jgi:tetratricopeptide (TPR) repeat protein
VNANLQRALLLFGQSRYEMADAELRQSLANDPDDAYAHALLGLCLGKQKQFKPATEQAEQAVHLAPDFAFAHYALADILHDRDRNEEALAAINEALRLDSSEADYFALLSAIRISEKHWTESLEAAERGLQLDSEHIGCTNLRAIALVKLGRKAEAGQTIGAALAKNPDNAVTHANQGWTLLEQSQPKKALEHFREALRLDPENEWARAGIVEALKARNFVYAIMLRYFLWMSRLSSRAQWAIILGGYFGNQLLGGVAKSNPELAPWVLPLRILYVAFALLTWTADPLFNLLLRLNRFGRLVLTREQIVSTNWIGSCLLLALLALAAFLLSDFSAPFLLAAAVFGFLVLPLAGTFKCAEGWPRKAMAAYTGAMAAAGIAAILLLFLARFQVGPTAKAVRAASVSLIGLFFIGVIGSAWVANILISQRPKR